MGMRRVIYFCVMGPLTVLAYSGCYWQYNRYKQSIVRWDRMAENMSNFITQKVEDLEFSYDSINDYEYKIINLDVKEVTDKTYYVSRVNNNQYGYFVLKPVLLTSGKYFLLKVGWIPEDLYYKEYKDAKDIKTISKYNQEEYVNINILIKKGEDSEMKNNTLYKQVLTDGTHRIINLNEIGKEYNNNDLYNKIYLEKIIKNDELLTDIYPYPTTNSTYTTPYLTPRKHIEYSIFWALTGTIGLASILFN